MFFFPDVRQGHRLQVGQTTRTINEYRSSCYKKFYKKIGNNTVMIQNPRAVCVGLLMGHTANPQSLIQCKRNGSRIEHTLTPMTFCELMFPAASLSTCSINCI